MTASVDTDRKIGAFRPLRVRRAAEEVVAVIVDAIRGGLYEPKDKLPRARDLAAALEVSRAVVGEAIGILERAGIVSVRRGHNGGIIVETRWIPPEVMAAIEGETYAGMRSLLEARRVLEMQASLLAGNRRTSEDITALTRLVEMLPELFDDADEFHAVDILFHVRLAESSGNEIIGDVVREILNKLMSSRAHYPVGHIDLQRALDIQRNTLDAIVEGTRERIVQSMDEHLGSAEEYFLGERLVIP